MPASRTSRRARASSEASRATPRTRRRRNRRRGPRARVAVSSARDVSPCPWLRNGEPPRSARRTRSVARGRVSVSVAKTSTTSASWRADAPCTPQRGTASGSPRTGDGAGVGAGVGAAEYPHVHVDVLQRRQERGRDARRGDELRRLVRKTRLLSRAGVSPPPESSRRRSSATGSPSARDADARTGGTAGVAVDAVTRSHLQAGDRDATHERSLNRHAGLATQGRDERLSVSFPSRDDRGGARVRGRVGGPRARIGDAGARKSVAWTRSPSSARLDRDAAIGMTPRCRRGRLVVASFSGCNARECGIVSGGVGHPRDRRRHAPARPPRGVQMSSGAIRAPRASGWRRRARRARAATRASNVTDAGRAPTAEALSPRQPRPSRWWCRRCRAAGTCAARWRARARASTSGPAAARGYRGRRRQRGRRPSRRRARPAPAVLSAPRGNNLPSGITALTGEGRHTPFAARRLPLPPAYDEHIVRAVRGRCDNGRRRARPFGAALRAAAAGAGRDRGGRDGRRARGAGSLYDLVDSIPTTTPRTLRHARGRWRRCDGA